MGEKKKKTFKNQEAAAELHNPPSQMCWYLQKGQGKNTDHAFIHEKNSF